MVPREVVERELLRVGYWKKKKLGLENQTKNARGVNPLQAPALVLVPKGVPVVLVHPRVLSSPLQVHVLIPPLFLPPCVLDPPLEDLALVLVPEGVPALLAVLVPPLFLPPCVLDLFLPPF